MSDIVEKLREACVIDRHYGKSVTLTLDYDDYMEAADEITRLRNELHIAQDWSARVIAGHEEDIVEITRLRAEVERLRDGRSEQVLELKYHIDQQYAEIVRFQDQIKRFKAALLPLICKCNEEEYRTECEADCPYWNARSAFEVK